jgi:hypothetical protein
MNAASSDLFAVVVEIGLRKNSYGADVRASEPTTRAEAEALLHRVLDGQEPDLYAPPPGSRILTIEAIDQYLVVGGQRLSPVELTRLSIASLYR